MSESVSLLIECVWLVVVVICNCWIWYRRGFEDGKVEGRWQALEWHLKVMMQRLEERDEG